jgi:hypothetical protein
MSDKKPILIALVDVAAEAREMYGDAVHEIAPDLPEHDWRFHVSWDRGEITTENEQITDGRTTFHVGATAGHVAAMLQRDGLLP